MKLSEEVLTVLSTLEFPASNRAVIAGQLDRKMYTTVDKALQAIGGKWNRSAKAHVFTCDARERVDLAIRTGQVETDGDVGHFPTPVRLAAHLVEMADVGDGHVVLEPSAGTGRIVMALLIDCAQVFAVERDAGRREKLQDMDAYKSGRLRVGECDDFMEYPLTCRFDRVVMNPPFCRVGKGDHLDHVKRAYGMLKPGGVLVSVFPSSITFRQDRRHGEFRAWCLDSGTIEPLPDGSFTESGTDVNTVAIRLER